MLSPIASNPLRHIVVAGAAVIAMCALPAAANAATVTIEGSELVFRAAVNEVNIVKVSKPSPDVLSVRDFGAVVFAGSGCLRSDAHNVNCLASGVRSIRIGLADLDDSAIVVGALPATIYGGDGHDLLDGDQGADVLYGEGGHDTLRGFVGQDTLRGDSGNDWLVGGVDRDDLDGGSGTDRLYGESGDDKLDGGPGREGAISDAGDMISGGEGQDWVTYYTHARAGVRVTIDAVSNDGVVADGENDNVHTDVEDLTGTAHKDLLIGSPSNNNLFGAENDDRLHGGAGNDTLRGEAGIDELHGWDGNDTLHARDNDRDWAFDCGAQTDTIYVDAVDALARNCERII